MSLINQMLHDLDSRRPQTNMRTAGYEVAGLHSPRAAIKSTIANKDRFSLGTNILFGTLVLLLAAVVGRYVSLIAVDNRDALPATVKNEAVRSDPSPLSSLSNQNIQLASLPGSPDNTLDIRVSAVQDRSQPVQITKLQSSELVPAIENMDMPATREEAPVLSKAPLQSAVKPENVHVKTLSSKVANTRQADQQPLSRTSVSEDTTDVTKKFRPLTAEQLAEAAYRTGLASIQHGKISEGIQELQNALSIYQGHLKAREILAGLLIKAGQSSEAAELLNKGIELHPGNNQYVKLYSRILLEQGNREMALQVLEANKPVLYSDPEYYAILAAVYQQLNQHQQAANIYNQLVSIQPQSGIFWMGLGISLEADGKPDKAVQAYQRAKTSGSLNSDLLRFINGKIATLKNFKSNSTA